MKKKRHNRLFILFLSKTVQHPSLVLNFFARLHCLALRRYYAWTDSKRILRSTTNKKLLFVDGGANLGQGFNFFSSYFPPERVEYDVFEPNPNCLEQLRKNLSRFSPSAVRIHPYALSTQDGPAKLYGTSECEGGHLSEGASINWYQHSLFYDTNPEDALSVPMIDFCIYLKSKYKYYSAIIVKLDIEGAENDLLEALIENDCLKCIDTLYVEFHSAFLKGPRRRNERLREARIIEHLKKSGIYFRNWN